MERVLPDAAVKARIGALAIGLAIDCDDPDRDVDELVRANLAGASMLPFAGFLTPDGKWIAGFSGYKDAAALTAVMAEAEKSPLLDATAAVRKLLEKVAQTASTAAEHGDWKAVLLAAREAGKSTGRCPERNTVDAAEKKARDWVAAQFDAVIQDAVAGNDLAPSQKRLADIRRHFAGEPEAIDADAGSKALRRLAQIRAAEARPNPAADLRDKAAVMFKDTRWSAAFGKPAATTPKDG